MRSLIDLVKCHDAKLKVKESEIHQYILLLLQPIADPQLPNDWRELVILQLGTFEMGQLDDVDKDQQG